MHSLKFVNSPLIAVINPEDQLKSRGDIILAIQFLDCDYRPRDSVRTTRAFDGALSGQVDDQERRFMHAWLVLNRSARYMRMDQLRGHWTVLNPGDLCLGFELVF